MSDTEPETDDYDLRVGQNIQGLRKARGMTQLDLADAVAARGVPWRQQTVVKVEKGQRPLRLQEADAISAALEVNVDVLCDEPVVFDRTALLIRHVTQLDLAWKAFADAGRELLEVKSRVEFSLWSASGSDNWQDIDRSVLNDAATMAQVDLEAIAAALVAEGRAQGEVQGARLLGAVEATTFDPAIWRERG